MLKLSIRTWLLAAALIAAIAPPCAGVILCRTVYDRLNPCYDYVTGNRPLGGCCGGVKRLYNEARTTPDKQSVCRCLKDVVRTHSRINVAKAANLPRLCGVTIPYRISLNIDCSK
ncbi:hypothetical protein C2S51_027016 [Perilla frutescens var. frutescens]|nr:hypothetical protein C2S51_027016 [Perilla frutescens var. frutescens]